jgi:hypothetical protein
MVPVAAPKLELKQYTACPAAALAMEASERAATSSTKGLRREIKVAKLIAALVTQR